MEVEITLRWLHVLGACTLFGTGAGIAFFMLMAHRTKDAAFIAQTARVVVIADTIFTATAAIVQPITGILLAGVVGWSLGESWIVASLGLYVFIGIFWLPVVWIQMQLRDLAKQAAETGAPLPARYHRMFRLWFMAGFPAFGAILVIFWLMLARPVLW